MKNRKCYHNWTSSDLDQTIEYQKCKRLWRAFISNEIKSFLMADTKRLKKMERKNLHNLLYIHTDFLETVCNIADLDINLVKKVIAEILNSDYIMKKVRTRIENIRSKSIIGSSSRIKTSLQNNRNQNLIK